MTELEHLNRLYATVLNRGALHLEELLQFEERGAPLRAWLAAELGCPTAEVSGQVEAGAVTNAVFLKVMDSEEARYWLIKPANMGDWKLNLVSCPPSPWISSLTKSLRRWTRSRPTS